MGKKRILVVFLTLLVISVIYYIRTNPEGLLQAHSWFQKIKPPAKKFVPHKEDVEISISRGEFSAKRILSESEEVTPVYIRESVYDRTGKLAITRKIWMTRYRIRVEERDFQKGGKYISIFNNGKILLNRPFVPTQLYLMLYYPIVAGDPVIGTVGAVGAVVLEKESSIAKLDNRYYFLNTVVFDTCKLKVYIDQEDRLGGRYGYKFEFFSTTENEDKKIMDLYPLEWTTIGGVIPYYTRMKELLYTSDNIEERERKVISVKTGAPANEETFKL